MTPFLSRLAGRIAILLAAGTLVACSVDVDEGGGRPRPRPQACTMEYMPVCGARGGDLQTFPNACT
ncbi:MAG: peptidase, partial [Shinella sp.]